MMDLLFHIGNRFPAESLTWLTTIQCLGWTSADIVIVVALLRMANACRGTLGMRKHQFSYLVLIGTLFFVPLIPFAQTGWTLFWVEVIITVPHFLLILYIFAVDWAVFPRFLAKAVQMQQGSSELR